MHRDFCVSKFTNFSQRQRLSLGSTQKNLKLICQKKKYNTRTFFISFILYFIIFSISLLSTHSTSYVKSFSKIVEIFYYVSLLNFGIFFKFNHKLFLQFFFSCYVIFLTNIELLGFKFTILLLNLELLGFIFIYVFVFFIVFIYGFYCELVVFGTYSIGFWYIKQKFMIHQLRVQDMSIRNF